MGGKIALIGLLGALGALTRYGVAEAAIALGLLRFPWATLIVNVVGCFLIGLCVHMGQSSNWLSEENAKVFIVGYLGALTTFSSFSYETIALSEKGTGLFAIANIVANLVLCLLATWLALRLGRAFTA